MDFSRISPTFPFPKPKSYVSSSDLEKVAAGGFSSRFAGQLDIPYFDTPINPPTKDAFSNAL